MRILLFLFSVGFGFFLWMYLLTYFMYRGVGHDFFQKVRIGLVRGMIVAGVFILFDSVDALSGYIQTDWILFPLIFFVLSLPFSWRRIGFFATLPVLLWVFVFCTEYFLSPSSFLWSPFHEEIGKWYQGITTLYPAILSPFVSLGFALVENARYFSVDLHPAEILGRSLFSLPLHLFVSLFAFWCFFSFRSRLLWGIVGIVTAILVHMLYNWSLSTSLIITLVIIMMGYAFYGWSIENGWWKKKI